MIRLESFPESLPQSQAPLWRVTLDRPDKANALTEDMLATLVSIAKQAQAHPNLRALVITGAGEKVFCAGADLKAMTGDVEPNYSTIPSPNKDILIGELFNKIYKPTIAVVNKDVYAGGFLILAGCLFVVANNKLNFSLPEVKRGLFPMQVMASLINIMPKRKVLDWCVRGYSITAKEALSLGLLSHICSEDKIESVTNKLVEEIKENSPKAISLGLEAYDNLYNTNNEHEYLSEMLNKMQQNDDAKEGLSAFKEKRKPNWTGN